MQREHRFERDLCSVTAGIILCGALLWRESAHAAPEQLRTAPNVMGGILMVLATADACNVEFSADRRRALLAAGERMRALSGLSDQDIARLGPSYRRTAEKTDCDQIRPMMDDVAQRLLIQADHVEGR